MHKPKAILIDGKAHLWRDIVQLRRTQLAAAREVAQPALFELIKDSRPRSQLTASARHEEPTLF